MFWIGCGVSFVVGVYVGIFVIALCIAAKDK
jgi:hypothetical protein